jgi:hypothetical protein
MWARFMMIQKYPIPHNHPWNCQKGEKRDDSGDELLNTDCYAILEKQDLENV